VECLDDAACSDGLACDGAERCVDGACQPGTPVVCGDFTHPSCLEPGVCVECRDDDDCDASDACHPRRCQPGSHFCEAADDPCPDLICDDVDGCRGCLTDDECDARTGGARPHCNFDGTCVECFGAAECADTSVCNGAELCLGNRCVDGRDFDCGIAGSCVEPGACSCNGGSGCAGDSDGERCLAGGCGCSNNTDCRDVARQNCVSGTCQRLP
jgi:hypothetical protein